MVTPEEAAQFLADRDPVIARLREEDGPPHVPFPPETPFAGLVRGITSQQIGGAAATAIHGRLIAALGGEVTPERMLTLSDATLRTVGLSGAKVLSLRDLSAKVSSGQVELTPRALEHRTDDEIVAQLSAVRGIGRWSAEMFLIFQLGRLDVWPTGDLAVRKGFGLAWGIPTPTPKELEPLGEPFRPYRTIAAWYCWVSARLYGRSSAGPTG
ncbi:DNA-3-methyladenine glycosylase family protein [Leifsonia sp. NPDC058248]|uniref:DNA-3-methyladenine glycosylase family protein n=1 Tax=Leifsonia sp. NPDC058248 TaxID=3346402 RepID=UPI0036DBCEB1